MPAEGALGSGSVCLALTEVVECQLWTKLSEIKFFRFGVVVIFSLFMNGFAGNGFDC